MLTFSRINRNIRSIRRYRNILGILIKYGFGHVVEQLNISYYLELGRRIVTLGTAPKEIERLTQPVRLRLAMEELGPTFVKLGQLLSTRPDLLPRDYIEEFRKLQDNVPSLPVEAVLGQLQTELGYAVEELFAEFFPLPSLPPPSPRSTGGGCAAGRRSSSRSGAPASTGSCPPIWISSWGWPTCSSSTSPPAASTVPSPW